MSKQSINRPTDSPANPPASQPPRLILREDDLLSRLLRGVRVMLVRNPETARVLVQSLVAEGRQFAATPEGERWRQALADSEPVQRGRMIWQAYGLDSLLGEEPALTPSDWLRLIMAELANADLEATLSTLMKEGATDGTVNPLRSDQRV